MKASEMICLLAKQIEMNGDRDVTCVISHVRDVEAYGDTQHEILSVNSLGKLIEIYGE